MKKIINEIKKLNKELASLPGIVPVTNTIMQNPTSNFEQLITDSGLRKRVSKLFHDGHHARAVEEAYKFIDNLVKKLARPENTSLTGAKLMTTVFSPNSPLLKLNSGSSCSENDEQIGYMQIFAGCMTGIRNPRAHECDWEDTEQRALQLLIIANHLVERLRYAEKQSISNIDGE